MIMEIPKRKTILVGHKRSGGHYWFGDDFRQLFEFHLEVRDSKVQEYCTSVFEFVITL